MKNKEINFLGDDDVDGWGEEQLVTRAHHWTRIHPPKSHELLCPLALRCQGRISSFCVGGRHRSRDPPCRCCWGRQESWWSRGQRKRRSQQMFLVLLQVLPQVLIAPWRQEKQLGAEEANDSCCHVVAKDSWPGHACELAGSLWILW